MAHLYDERGNQLQLTDEHGNPVTLTDEHGRPMHLTGVATTDDPTSVDVVTDTTIGVVGATLGGSSGPPGGSAVLVDQHPEVSLFEPPPPLLPHQHQQVLPRSGTSSSSSSSAEEEDGQGGRRRRKKKGLTEKIKEKLLPAAAENKHKNIDGDEDQKKMQAPASLYPRGAAAASTRVSHSSAPLADHHHEKKSVIEKIREKLPGTHH